MELLLCAGHHDSNGWLGCIQGFLDAVGDDSLDLLPKEGNGLSSSSFANTASYALQAVRSYSLPACTVTLCTSLQ